MANCCISFPFLHLFVGVDSTQKWPFPWRLFVQEKGWEAGTGCLKGLAVLFVALLAMFTQTTTRFSAFGPLPTLGSSLPWQTTCILILCWEAVQTQGWRYFDKFESKWGCLIKKDMLSVKCFYFLLLIDTHSPIIFHTNKWFPALFPILLKLVKQPVVLAGSGLQHL